MNTVLHYKYGPYLPITENWIYGQIRYFEKYSPIVYCHGTENADAYPVKNIRSFPRIKKVGNISDFLEQIFNRGLSYYYLIPFFLAKDKPAIVHCHFGPSGFMFLRFKRKFGLPMVTTFYGYDLSMLPASFPKWKRRYARLFMEGDRFLVEGHYMKKSLVALGCPSGKITVNHLGVEVNKIKFIKRSIKFNEEIRVLIAGSFREKKGIPYAVEAFGKVAKANPCLKLKLSIIGNSNGAPREELEKRKILDKIIEFDLKDKVNLLGYQPHSVFLEELYKHHIFLSPSVKAEDGDTEGGVPVSIIEASASGMPIVSTFHCDIPEVVLEGKSGYLVQERDVDALKERLEFLLLNQNIWENFGTAGRAHVQSNYDAENQSKKLEKIYNSMIDI